MSRIITKLNVCIENYNFKVVQSIFFYTVGNAHISEFRISTNSERREGETVSMLLKALKFNRLEHSRARCVRGFRELRKRDSGGHDRMELFVVPEEKG